MVKRGLDLGERPLGKAELVPERVRSGVTGAAAIVGEPGLSIGFECVVVGGTQGHYRIAEAGLESRGYPLRLVGDIVRNTRAECSARDLSPVTLSRRTCDPGVHSY